MTQIQSVSRVYADVVVTKSEEYSDFTKIKVCINDRRNYRIVKRLGEGRYSDVYEGLNLFTKKTVALKLLKPVRTDKIRREVKILRVLDGGINVIKLLDVVDFYQLRATALVFEKVGQHNFSEIYLNLCEYDIRFYTYQLLKGLDYCHSMGIMHRDVKPQNVVTDHERKILKLIDFGLADFYIPGQDYTLQVCSRYYMAPELLVEYVYYNYSLDMWSLGCILANMVFCKNPFFEGINFVDQLIKVASVLGTTELVKYLLRYGIEFDLAILELVDTPERKNWEIFKDAENKHLINQDVCDFLDLVLCYDHVARITAREALKHPYFSLLINDQHQRDGPSSATLTSAEIIGVDEAT